MGSFSLQVRTAVAPDRSSLWELNLIYLFLFITVHFVYSIKSLEMFFTLLPVTSSSGLNKVEELHSGDCKQETSRQPLHNIYYLSSELRTTWSLETSLTYNLDTSETKLLKSRHIQLSNKHKPTWVWLWVSFVSSGGGGHETWRHLFTKTLHIPISCACSRLIGVFTYSICLFVAFSPSLSLGWSRHLETGSDPPVV